MPGTIDFMFLWVNTSLALILVPEYWFLAPFLTLKRIFQAGGGSVIKHAGVAIDAKRLHSHWQ